MKNIAGAPVTELEISKLQSFRQHIFPTYSGARLDRLIESIKSIGVLTPIIVRALDFKGTRYEILAGHNRVNAAKIAGLTVIPAISVIPQTEEEAKLIVIETNMCQRSLSEIPVSVKAKAIAQWYECIKKQGFRTDLLDELSRLEQEEQIEKSSYKQEIISAFESAKKPLNFGEKSTSGQICPSLNSAEYIAEKTGLSIKDIQRLIRIAKLPDELLQKVDNEVIPFMAAYELSFVPRETLDLLNIVMDNDKSVKITIKAAQQLRYACRSGKIISSSSELMKVLEEKSQTPKKEKALSVTLKPKTLNRYFEGISNKKIVAEKVEQSLELTEVTIPRILKENDSEDLGEDKERLIFEALNLFLQNNKSKG